MNSTWKEHLRTLEKAKKWDEAIEFMKGVIQKNPDDMDAYIFMNFLLMNLLVEEDYDKRKEKEYETLLKWYFDESYAKFSYNAEYLFFTAITAVMSEWNFGIDVKDYEEMFKKAHQLDPGNPLYLDFYYLNLWPEDAHNPDLLNFARLILSENSPIKKQLKNMGALGEYLLEMQERWSQRVLDFAEKKKIT